MAGGTEGHKVPFGSLPECLWEFLGGPWVIPAQWHRWANLCRRGESWYQARFRDAPVPIGFSHDKV